MHSIQLTLEKEKRAIYLFLTFSKNFLFEFNGINAKKLDCVKYHNSVFNVFTVLCVVTREEVSWHYWKLDFLMEKVRICVTDYDGVICYRTGRNTFLWIHFNSIDGVAWKLLIQNNWNFAIIFPSKDPTITVLVVGWIREKVASRGSHLFFEPWNHSTEIFFLNSISEHFCASKSTPQL